MYHDGIETIYYLSGIWNYRISCQPTVDMDDCKIFDRQKLSHKRNAGVFGLNISSEWL
jgi:hypothetical protein